MTQFKKKSQERGKELRVLPDIDENSIIAYRDIRNHFEHYDERIECLFQGKSSVNFIDLAFNPFKQEKWETPKYYQKAYNQVNGIVTFNTKRLF